jgi:hypothetical protein
MSRGNIGVWPLAALAIVAAAGWRSIGARRSRLSQTSAMGAFRAHHLGLVLAGVLTGGALTLLASPTPGHGQTAVSVPLPVTPLDRPVPVNEVQAQIGAIDAHVGPAKWLRQEHKDGSVTYTDFDHLGHVIIKKKDGTIVETRTGDRPSGMYKYENTYGTDGKVTRTLSWDEQRYRKKSTTVWYPSGTVTADSTDINIGLDSKGHRTGKDSETTTTTVSNPNGSSTIARSEQTTLPDGSAGTSVTTVAKNPDGSTTTTVTLIDAKGYVVSSDTIHPVNVPILPPNNAPPGNTGAVPPQNGPSNSGFGFGGSNQGGGYAQGQQRQRPYEQNRQK